MKSEYLKDSYKRLSDSERSAFNEYVMGVAVDDALKNRTQFELDPAFEWLEDIQERNAKWGQVIGLSSGYGSVDRMTMGIAPGELIVVGGATSNGKTALCINIAANLLKQDKRVLFITLEMTQAELGSRFMKIMGDDFEKHMDALYFQKSDELNWKSIDGLMRKAKEEAGVDCVIIDHLHYFTRELKNVAEDLGNITKEFKKNAIRHQLPVVLVSHTRKGEKSNTTSTGINDLRGSSYIAQDADIVLMVEREREHPDKIIVRLEKNRNRSGVAIGTDTLMDFFETKITEPDWQDIKSIFPTEKS